MNDKFVVPSFFSILEVILTASAVPSFPSSSNDFFQLGVSVGIYLFKFSNIWNLLNVSNRDTRTTSLTLFLYLYFQLWTDFTHWSGVCFVDFEQANAKKLKRTNNYYGKANLARKVKRSYIRLFPIRHEMFCG